MRRNIFSLSAILVAVVSLSAQADPLGRIVLSDSFSRDPAGTPVGTPPSKDTTATAQADAATNWVSSWGANNNALGGGYVTQTYTTYLGNDGAAVQRNFKVDGTNGISGNWLNNGVTLKKTGGIETTVEPIGITGFAWTQINHNFAADTAITAAGASGKLRINFDLYRTASGNHSWFFGQSDATGVANGNAGSPSVTGNNDVGIYWRGVQANTFGLRDNAALPAPVDGIANYDTVAYALGTTLFPQPIPIQIDITGTNFAEGQTSLIEIWVGGTKQDLNGTTATGEGYTFTWDNGGAAYMGFGSNSTPVEGTVAEPVLRAQGIDNLVISTLAPTILAGDYNDDDTVDAADYTVWRDNLDTNVTLPNDSTPGTVTAADYDVWKNNFNLTGGSSVANAAAVPEPATFALVVMVALAGWVRRKR